MLMMLGAEDSLHVDHELLDMSQTDKAYGMILCS